MVRVAIHYIELSARCILEIPHTSIPNAYNAEDGAIRFADWARAQDGVVDVRCKGTQVLVKRNY